MANVNKVILIGRLTRDPEVRTFSTGGKVAKFGFAVSNRKKNSQTGQWEDVPMFIDCEAYNRGEYSKQADLVEQYLSKGRQVFLEGHLQLDQWDDKTTGQKRSKHKVVVDHIQFLGSREGAEQGPRTSAPADGDYGGDEAPRANAPSGNDDIPF
jgi:single-strand DNA-binding protein